MNTDLTDSHRFFLYQRAKKNFLSRRDNTFVAGKIFSLLDPVGVVRFLFFPNLKSIHAYFSSQKNTI